eukprot:scaffold4.g4831.t1
MLAGDEGRIAFARLVEELRRKHLRFSPRAEQPLIRLYEPGKNKHWQALVMPVAAGVTRISGIRAKEQETVAACFDTGCLEGQQFDGDALADIVAKVMEGLAKGDKELAAEARQAAGPWRVEVGLVEANMRDPALARFEAAWDRDKKEGKAKERADQQAQKRRDADDQAAMARELTRMMLAELLPASEHGLQHALEALDRAPQLIGQPAGLAAGIEASMPLARAQLCKVRSVHSYASSPGGQNTPVSTWIHLHAC